MRIASKIWDSGWGAVFLTVYSLGVIHQFTPNQHLIKPFALLPTLLVMFAADRFSNKLIDFFAGGELRRSTDQVARITGGEDFYESASQELQTRIDDLDRRTYQNNISIISGTLIGISAPIFGYFGAGLIGTGVGLTVGLLALHLLSYRSIQAVNKLAEDVSKPFEAKYENQ